MDSFIPTKAQAERIAAEYGTPVFVTDAGMLRARAKSMLAAFDWPKTKILYAIKANSNPALVRELKAAGIHGIDAVSVHEVRLARDLGFVPDDIVFTGSNPSTDEIRTVTEQGVLLNAGSLSEVKRFGELFPGQKIALRINPGVGAGHHAKTTTGGETSKFGIVRADFAAAKELLQKYGLALAGIHSHVGSGFSTPDEFLASVRLVLEEAADFPELEFVDFGGGFAVPYRPEQNAIDLEGFGAATKALLESFSEQNGKQIEMRIEPGRYLVAESTALLTRVTTVKPSAGRLFVGTDTGMHHLIRPAMYDAYHHVVNVSDPNGEVVKADVVGNVCESSDFFGRDLEVTEPREGDLLAILTAGAYGSVMSSNYNLQPMAAEVLLDDGAIRLTRRRQSYEQMLEDFVR